MCVCVCVCVCVYVRAGSNIGDITTRFFVLLHPLPISNPNAPALPVSKTHPARSRVHTTRYTVLSRQSNPFTDLKSLSLSLSLCPSLPPRYDLYPVPFARTLKKYIPTSPSPLFFLLNLEKKYRQLISLMGMEGNWHINVSK